MAEFVDEDQFQTASLWRSLGSGDFEPLVSLRTQSGNLDST